MKLTVIINEPLSTLHLHLYLLPVASDGLDFACLTLFFSLKGRQLMVQDQEEQSVGSYVSGSRILNSFHLHLFIFHNFLLGEKQITLYTRCFISFQGFVEHFSSVNCKVTSYFPQCCAVKILYVVCENKHELL